MTALAAIRKYLVVRHDTALAPRTDIEEADVRTHVADKMYGSEVAAKLPMGARIAAAVTRIAMGFYFFWAFIDKTFGLGFSTPAEGAWVNGGSPTAGYLSGVEGPFGSFFNGLAGAAWIDWIFMIGLLGIGLALLLGIGMRIAAVSATVMLALMYLASLPLVTNPILDSHITQALAIILVTVIGAGSIAGLGAAWQRLPVVQHNRWLI